MKLEYEGVDISADVSIACAWHDMYATGRSDELLLKLNDTRNLWDAWGPKEGDTIKVSDGTATTGMMQVVAVKPQSSLIAITALAMPKDAARERRWKSWEQVRLSQLIGEICNRYQLEYSTYGITDRLYSYVEQGGLADFEFLARRCAYEGAGFLAYDGKIIVYDGLYMDSQTPAGTINVTPGDSYQFNADDDARFSACMVTDGTVTGEFRADSGGKVFNHVIGDRISDQAEGNRFARGLLRHKNKGTRTLKLTTETFLRSYAAGSVVNINAPAAASWDGPAFIEHMRHDYVRRRSMFEARQVIEGY